MAEREPGPYWVRDRFEDEWVLALWSGFGWTLHGDEEQYRDADFIEIGPRAELPPPVIVETTTDDSAQPAVVHYDLNTPEGKRALAAFLQLPQWPDPEPITDAQKTGERFLVRILRTRHPRLAHGWVEAYWDADYWMTDLFMPDGELIFFDDDEVTHSMPLPPSRQWSDEG